MSEATTDRALAGNVIEEEVLPPEPTTKAIILGEVVGWFLGAAALMAMFSRNLFDFAASKNINIGSPASTGLAAAFTTYSPNPGIKGAASGGFTTVPFLEGLAGEVLGTAILLLVILSL